MFAGGNIVLSVSSRLIYRLKPIPKHVPVAVFVSLNKGILKLFG